MITRRLFLTSCAVAGLTACAAPSPRLGPDGQPLPLLHRIDPAEAGRIPPRVLQQVNTLRAQAGSPALTLDPALSAAASRHAGDMAGRGATGHTGSDGSTPVTRAAQAGFAHTVLGENTAETYAADAETIRDWMQRADTRATLLDPAARDLGIGFHQDGAGKLWWVLMTGDGRPRDAG